MKVDPVWKASAAGLLHQLGPIMPDRRYVLALDTSGGMKVSKVMSGIAFMTRLIVEKNNLPLTLLQFDHAVRDVREINSVTDFGRIGLWSGGGTDYIPVSNYLRHQPDLITAVVVTDGMCDSLPDRFGKIGDKVGWFLTEGGEHAFPNLPGPKVVANDDRWTMFGDGPRLYTEDEQ